MTKRVKNIATTSERNNALWKTVSQGASFTPWRTFENSTCLSGTKIKQNWSDITGLVKHCCPPRLTLSHWRNEFPTYQLCSYPTTMEGLYLFKTHKFFNPKEKGTTFFPVTCLSIFQCQIPQLCSNLSSSYHPALSVRAVSKMTIKRDTNTTNLKKNQRKADTPLHPGLQKFLTHGAPHCQYAITIVITWESQLTYVDCIFFNLTWTGNIRRERCNGETLKRHTQKPLWTY